MAYCAPPQPNSGFLDHGCALYGGIQIRPDAANSAKASEYYIPQFNLATYWQKPFLVPHSLGFPRVLTRPLEWPGRGSSSLIHQAPGHWRFDTPREQLRNRNLMAGCGEGDVVRLWTVNEISDRKTLNQFTVRKEENHSGFQAEWKLVQGSQDGDLYEPDHQEVSDYDYEDIFTQPSHSSKKSKLGGRGSGRGPSKKSRVLLRKGERLLRKGQRLPSSTGSESERSFAQTSMSNRSDVGMHSGSDMSLFDDDENGEDSGVKSVHLPSAALQLLSWPSNREGSRVLIRTENELCMWNSKRQQLNQLYSSKVHSVCPMPHMHNELVLLDDNNMVWFGGLEQDSMKLSRVKCSGEVQLVSPSDHPRLIYVADEDQVWMVDLRDATSHGSMLYSIPPFDDTSRCGKDYSYEGAFPKSTIQHITSFNQRPRMLLVTTSNKVTIVDERMPGVCYIQQSHSVPDGGDYIYSAPPLQDNCLGGKVYPFYILHHLNLPDIQQLAYYEHDSTFDSSTFYSSLGSVRRLPEPCDIQSFMRENQNGVRMSKNQSRRLLGDGPSRALHVEERDGALVLFRMLSDGSVWYDEVGISDDSAMEQEALRNSVDTVRGMVNEAGEERGPLWEEGVLESLLQQPHSLVRHYKIDGPMTSSRMDDENSLERMGNPMGTQQIGDHPPWEPTADCTDPEHILSDVVMNCWDKYK